MKRIAFKMKLKTGCADEYKRRHANIWPEIVQLLKKQGVEDYSIFLDEETNTLFACQKVGEENADSQNFSSEEEKEIIYKWWNYMADIMETNSDKSPISIYLKEMFHLD